MARPDALHRDLRNEDDLDDAWLARQSGTRRIARPIAPPEGEDSPPPEMELDNSERPTLRVPRFEVLGGGVDNTYSRVLEEGGWEVDHLDAPTVPAPAFWELPPEARDAAERRLSSRVPPSYSDLGSLQSVPRIVQPAANIRAAGLDHREAFVLVLIDGRIDIETILDASPLPMHDVLRILLDLRTKGLIAID